MHLPMLVFYLLFLTVLHFRGFYLDMSALSYPFILILLNIVNKIKMTILKIL